MTAAKLVRDIMGTNLTTLDHESRLLDAVLLMRSSGYRHLPVLNGDKLVGIVSDRDVQRVAPSLLSRISQEEYNRIFEGTPITRVMVREVLTVTPTTPVQEAVKIIYENKFGCIPVVEQGNRLVGIVTVTDFLGVLDALLSKS
ncbi:MAG: CBS domain-containing protein [Terriglobia bacterium]